MENTITTEKMLYSKDKLISELSAMTVALSQKEKETLDIKPYTEEDHARFTKLNNTKLVLLCALDYLEGKDAPTILHNSDILYGGYLDDLTKK